MSIQSDTLFDFQSKSDLNNWYVVNDGVMGGLSAGSLKITSEGYGLFDGYVSTDNNGGFTSIRYSFESLVVSPECLLRIRVKGDGKKYQLRVKSSSRDYYSYITSVETSGEWETLDIPLSDMYPSFRGRRLSQSTFDQKSIEEFGILIGNKRDEKFVLYLDKIELVCE